MEQLVWLEDVFPEAGHAVNASTLAAASGWWLVLVVGGCCWWLVVVVGCWWSLLLVVGGWCCWLLVVGCWWLLLLVVGGGCCWLLVVVVVGCGWWSLLVVGGCCCWLERLSTGGEALFEAPRGSGGSSMLKEFSSLCTGDLLSTGPPGSGGSGGGGPFTGFPKLLKIRCLAITNKSNNKQQLLKIYIKKKRNTIKLPM
jgi:hypothetical protein